jgi:hypothetical protein
MSPESHTSLSRRAVRRAEKLEWQGLEDQLGKNRVKSLRGVLSKMATGKVMVFPVTETHLNIPPAPNSPERF